MRNRSLAILLTLALFACRASADGAADNLPEKVRRVPPPGIKISDADRAALADGIAALAADVRRVRAEVKDPKLAARWPDVQIYVNAVQYALDLDQIYKPAEIEQAK